MEVSQILKMQKEKLVLKFYNKNEIKNCHSLEAV